MLAACLLKLFSPLFPIPRLGLGVGDDVVCVLGSARGAGTNRQPGRAGEDGTQATTRTMRLRRCVFRVPCIAGAWPRLLLCDSGQPGGEDLDVRTGEADRWFIQESEVRTLRPSPVRAHTRFTRPERVLPERSLRWPCSFVRRPQGRTRRVTRSELNKEISPVVDGCKSRERDGR